MDNNLDYNDSSINLNNAQGNSNSSVISLLSGKKEIIIMVLNT